MTGALFALTLRQAAAPKRLALLTAVALLPVGLAALLVGVGDSTQADLLEDVLVPVMISLILPLVTMVLATGAFGNEVEDRTLSLLTTKPVSRWALTLAKTLSTALVAGPILMAATALIPAMAPDRTAAVVAAAAVGGLVGALAYTSVFTWAGLITTRALALGLVYLLLWEVLLTGFLSGLRYLSIRSYALGVMRAMEGDAFESSLALGATAAIVGAVVVIVGFYLLAVRRLSRMDISS